MTDLRDRCCWRACRAEPDLTFKGVGLCNAHWAQACAVYIDTTTYILSRVVPEAAQEITTYTTRATTEAT